MKITLELPDEVMREVKIRAVHKHKKLKDTVAELIRKGIAADKSEVRRQHGNDGVVEQLVARVRLHNEHGPHFGPPCVAERMVHHYHVATPVDHGLTLLC